MSWRRCGRWCFVLLGYVSLSIRNEIFVASFLLPPWRCCGCGGISCRVVWLAPAVHSRSYGSSLCATARASARLPLLLQGAGGGHWSHHALFVAGTPYVETSYCNHLTRCSISFFFFFAPGDRNRTIRSAQVDVVDVVQKFFVLKDRFCLVSLPAHRGLVLCPLSACSGPPELAVCT